MARISNTGGKKDKAKARKAFPARGPKTAKTRRGNSSSIADLREQLKRLAKELNEAQERQAATAEILKIIAASPSDPQPVFERILYASEKLTPFQRMAIFLRRDDMVHVAAGRDSTGLQDETMAALRAVFPMRYEDTPMSVAVAQGRAVYFGNVQNNRQAPESLRRAAEHMGNFSVLVMPMWWEGQGIGAFHVARGAQESFSDNEVALLENFARQAVIAIQNARLFNETRDALERQTATAEVLGVISNSMADTQPVFESICAGLKRLMPGADLVISSLGDDGLLHWRAGFGELIEQIRASFPRPAPMQQGLVTGVPSNWPDIMRSPGVPESLRASFAAIGRNASMLSSAMSSDGRVLGTLAALRLDMRPFTNEEARLLKAFADQAVIAIQNARLFNEVKKRTEDLTESLQQQTATADVLKVISRAAFDLESVMDTLTQSAAKLCKAEISALYLREGEVLVARGVAHADAAKADFLRRTPLRIDSTTYIGRAFLAGSISNIANVAQVTDIGRIKSFSEILNFQSIVFVPLMREERSIGIFGLGRKRTGRFSQSEIDLVQTFADQAVIAIENVRLFDEVQAKTRELTESLTYQTGSANILSVIASSPTDVQPVMNAIVKSACELCGAYDSVALLKEDDHLLFSAHHGPIPTRSQKRSINRRWIAGRAFIDKKPIHVHDLQAEWDEFPEGMEMARDMGHRSIVSVPLLREGESVGALVLRRLEVNPFSEKQIRLLETFADQAVIAIENARLFNETQEALERQTATADILKVIASSPTDTQPVFEAIVQSGLRLFPDSAVMLVLANDGVIRPAAIAEADPRLAEMLWHAFPVPLTRDYVHAVAILDGQVVDIPDAQIETDEYPIARRQFLSSGHRAITIMPMMRGDQSIGALSVVRPLPGSLSDRQLELLRTFADQAVIAIENTRLLKELRKRTDDLSESLQQQTATSEVLQVISSSPGELEPIFQSMLENATRICGANFGTMYRYDGAFHLMASHNAPQALVEARMRTPVHRPPPDTGLGRMERTRQVVHIHDITIEAGYAVDHAYIKGSKLSGARTILLVPMLKEAELVGSINIFRKEVHPFTDKQVELLGNFAKQAVIAIENARLLKELRQRTADLSRSLDDLRAAQDRLVQTEKLASLGQLTAGIAHEIKNPLNFVNNFAALSAELIDEMTEILENPELDESGRRRELDDIRELLKGNLEKVVQHGKRADSIVKNMLLHSRQGAGEHRPVEINALVDESMNLAYHGARAENADFNIALGRDFDPGAGLVDVYPQEITRVLLNVISNGFYAATRRASEVGDGSEPKLWVATKDLGEKVEIRVRDNGIGIPDEVKDKIFNPFFTTKPAGEGTGLGLSMSHDIVVKQHGGTIEIETEVGAFTEFRIVLPRMGTLTK